MPFTCAANNHASTHAYPSASDPAYNTALNIESVTATTITVDVGQPGAGTVTCANVASAITVLFSTLIQAVGTDASPNGNLTGITRTAAPNTDELPVFGFNQSDNEWNDKSILDLSDPNNALYKFNAATGGVIVPRDRKSVV